MEERKMEIPKKKKWVKPECVRVKLVPEEAILLGCKDVNGFANGAPGCNSTGHRCHAVGS